MSATAQTEFEAAPDLDDAPEEFVTLSVRELDPHDITTTPPVTAKLYMSPEFTNEGGADVEFGKTRDYYVVLEYPEGMENTVVLVEDFSTSLGSRLFQKFVEGVAVDKGYDVERGDVTEFLEGE